MPKDMTPSRPYLLRAFYEWIVDNECTPYIVVNAAYPGTQVPNNYVEDGRIVLDISPMAVKHLSINNDLVEFSARFNGAAMRVIAPIAAVLAVYAQENGHGMVFSDDDQFPPPSPTSSGGDDSSGADKKGKPTLKLVK